MNALLSPEEIQQAILEFIARRQPAKPIELADAIRQHLEWLAGWSRPKNVDNRKYALNRFRGCVGDLTLSAIDREACERFLNQYRSNPSPHVFNASLRELRAFVNWCIEKPRRWFIESPLEGIEPLRAEQDLIKVLSVQQVKDLMAHLEEHEPDMVPYYAVALFGGVRPKEIERLNDRADLIDLEFNLVRISPAISKTGDKRDVVIRPNFREWLVRYGKEVLPNNSDRKLAAIRKRFKLSPDICRHTFSSMHVGAFGSFAAESMEAGHSEEICRKHYCNRVLRSDAEAFWSITPINNN